MGRSPSKPSSEEIIKFKTGSKGVPWSAKEDQILVNYINFHGEGRWTKVAKQTGYFTVLNRYIFIFYPPPDFSYI